MDIDWEVAKILGTDIKPYSTNWVAACDVNSFIINAPEDVKRAYRQELQKLIGYSKRKIKPRIRPPFFRVAGDHYSRPVQPVDMCRALVKAHQH